MYGYLYSRPILKISQAKGLRDDPECGCILETFGFME